MVYIRPDVRLYSEATLQVYYMVMSVYGWMAWTKKKDETASSESLISIQRWTIKQHLMAFGSGIVLLLLLGSFWSWMGGALPYVDAFTTAFSIIATYMVTQKIIENWIYWIVIDLVSVFINWERGLYLFAVLFAVYCIVAIFGFIEWRRKELKINRTHQF
jgi:nicotinamide mononucleotide transporter